MPLFKQFKNEIVLDLMKIILKIVFHVYRMPHEGFDHSHVLFCFLCLVFTCVHEPVKEFGFALELM